MKNQDEIKLLLLQTRPDIMKHHEYKAILEVIDLRPSQLIQADALDYEKIKPEILQGYDGLIMGGDGHHSIMEDHDFLPPMKQLLQFCYNNNFPVFAICMGAQILAKLYHGELVDDPTLKEVKTVHLTLTEEGKKHPIMAGLPNHIKGNAFHNQTVTKLPEGAVNLCTGPKDIPYCFAFKDKPIIATQFHIELTRKHLEERLYFYMDKYLPGGEPELKEIMKGIEDRDISQQMLTNFLNLL